MRFGGTNTAATGGIRGGFTIVKEVASSRYFGRYLLLFLVIIIAISVYFLSQKNTK